MSARRTRSRSAFPGLAALLMLLLVCLAAALALVFLEMVPDLARQLYGAPDVNLGMVQTVNYSARLLLARDALLTPASRDEQPIPFTVTAGESPNSISFRLEEDGLIQDSAAFRLYLIYSGIDRRIQAGTYRINPVQNSIEIAHQLEDATPTEAQLTILPGWRAEEIAAALPTTGLSITPQEFLSLTRNFPADWLPADWPVMTNVEGFLSPGTYTLQRDVGVEELVQTLVGRTAERLTPELLQAYERQGLSLTEAVTLASIVEKEGVVDEEHPIIASVFYNRLAAGMKLDSDPTVQYAVGYNTEQETWWTNPLSVADLQYDSAYNTYRYPGLPPGPICNPGLSALQAVAFPAQTPYYYFRALCDSSGRHAFAVTYEEHLQNDCD